MLDKLTQLHKSKFIKCFLIALVLVFSYEVSKPKAIAPLIGWGASILGGMIVQEAAEMGIKWGTKTVMKKKADDWAADMWNNGKGDFDFAKSNPYLNKDGSVAISPSARDRAKIASMLAGAGAGMLIDDALREDGNGSAGVIPEGHTFYPVADPLYSTEVAFNVAPLDVKTPLHTMSYGFLMKIFDIEVAPVPYMQGSEITLRSTVSNEVIRIVADSTIASPDPERFNFSSSAYSILTGDIRLSNAAERPGQIDIMVKRGTSQFSWFGYKAPISVKAFEEYMRMLKEHNTKIYLAQGLMIPETIEKVYQYPNNYIPPDYEVPNKRQLEAKPPIVIPNMMPAGGVEGNISWADIENNYDNSTQIRDIIDIATDTYLENGDINNTTYNMEIVNNYYTDIGQDKTKEEVEKEFENIKPPAENGGGAVVPSEPVSGLDGSMWEVMKNTYDYLDDGIDSSLAAMKGITDSASGITTYLGQTMGWLPAEWRAVFTSAFVLGVFAHFLRR